MKNTNEPSKHLAYFCRIRVQQPYHRDGDHLQHSPPDLLLNRLSRTMGLEVVELLQPGAGLTSDHPIPEALNADICCRGSVHITIMQ